ncbi:MerR family transcriptional regulator [Streptomyces javensis]|uniref:MerR family transcriptional regulator n=1 Tax=Streptomyces javensis TaxID=114698 RepID=UPI00340D6B55
MAWSTREIAELAGTSLRAVRHYHEVGLLEEPERRANGYKQYGVPHLVRLLRIKRLTDLGFSLSQIALMGEADGLPEEILRSLDAELASTIQRLQRTRVELGLYLRQSVPSELPPEFAQAIAQVDLSDADRSFLVVLSRVVGPRRLRAYAEMYRSHPDDPVTSEFDTLPAEADERTRQDVAERLAPYVRGLWAEHPGLNAPHPDDPYSARVIGRTMDKARRDLYNPAQLDVIRRTRHLLRTPPQNDQV